MADVYLCPLKVHVVAACNVCRDSIVHEEHALLPSYKLVLYVVDPLSLEVLRHSVPLEYRLYVVQLLRVICWLPILSILLFVPFMYCIWDERERYIYSVDVVNVTNGPVLRYHDYIVLVVIAVLPGPVLVLYGYYILGYNLTDDRVESI